jgi:hypothetical protein
MNKKEFRDKWGFGKPYWDVTMIGKNERFFSVDIKNYKRKNGFLCYETANLIQQSCRMRWYIQEMRKLCR